MKYEVGDYVHLKDSVSDHEFIGVVERTDRLKDFPCTKWPYLIVKVNNPGVSRQAGDHELRLATDVEILEAKLTQ